MNDPPDGGATERQPLAAASPREEVVLFAVAFSMVAGIIHVEASFIHADHIWWYSALFALLAAFQIGWALRLYARPTDALIRLGAAVAVATIAVWVVSRTVGIPFGPEAWEPESVGTLDLGATVDEVAIVVLAAALLRQSLDWLLTSAGRLAVYGTITLTAVTLFLGGGHGH